MLKLSLAFGLTLFAGACVAPSSSVPAPVGRAAFQAGDTQNPMEDPEFLAAMAKYMTPGEQHAELAAKVGKWNVASKVWMSPGDESMEMAATADSHMIFGGRYYVESFAGEMMGAPFEGENITGYNTITDEWWSFWIDSMSTGYAVATGKADASGAITLTGVMRDAMSPDGRPYRMVTHPDNEDGSFMTEMFDTLPDGTEWKVMEMVYTRAPKEGR